MNVHVNENCIGCGLCTTMCPDVFTMTDEQEPAAQEAAESCPVDAIQVS